MSRGLNGSLSRLAHHESIIWVFGLLTAIVGHGAATSFLDWVEGRESHSTLGWIGAFFILTVIFYYLYENPFPQRLRPGLKWRIAVTGFVPWLLGGLAAIALFGVAVMVHRGFATIFTFQFVIHVSWLVATTAGFFVFRRNVLVIHSRYLRGERLTGDTASSDPPGPRHVVAALSIATAWRDNHYLPRAVALSDPPDLALDLERLAAAKKARPPRQVTVRHRCWLCRLHNLFYPAFRERMLQETAAPVERWPWEMLLRAFWPHRISICEITLVCSHESLPEAPHFARILRRYREFRGVRINIWAEHACTRSLHEVDSGALPSLRGFDFGNLDEMSSAMTDLLKYLQVGRGVRPRDILVDFTGGTKPVSVVAATLTLRSDIRAQNVDTNDLWPTAYDLVSNPEVKGGA